MSNHRVSRIIFSIVLLGVWAWAAFPPTASAVSSAAKYRPVSPEELKMTSEPAAPGAPAVILYREVYRDDSGRTAHEDDYYRVKILTEEGRKFADVEIPFEKDMANVTGIHARTIKSDGTIVDFDGKVFTKSIVKARGLKILAKTFTMPAIQVGCILEYYYTIDLSEDYIIASHWIVSDELFTKAGDFSLKRYTSDYANYRVSWTWQNMPEGTTPAKEGPDQIIRLHVSNVPAFPTEDFMPPENEMKARVDFSYSLDAPDTNVNHFWAGVGKRMNGKVESFVGKPKAMQEAVAEIVAPNDPPEVKLQKLYARVQQMRNTSFEVRKTEAEENREKQKAPGNAEDVWRRGYGDREEITLLYMALVRAAGFEAYGVKLADRATYFFDPNLMQSGRLNSFVVLIKLSGKDVYCDPGGAFTPFGLLPWPETFIQGLRLDKKEPVWVATAIPHSTESRTERRADLTLTETGDLEGKLTVTYTGLEAAQLRQDERNADGTERKTHLENTVKGYIPAACEVKLTNQPEWKNPALPLVAEIDLKVPGWASGAGRHVLIAAGLFSNHEKHLFDHAERIYPIYIDYPYAVSDDIKIQLPTGWQVSSLPPGWKDDGKVVAYTLAAQNENGKLHLTRTLTVDFVLIQSKYYSSLRHYFQEIKNTDDQQIVLDPGAARAGN